MGEADELARVTSISTWGDLAFLNLPERGADEALVFPDQRRTYAEFADQVVRRAKSLIALGVQPGDNLGILMGSSIEYLELLFASACVGAVSVVINSRYRAHELAFVLKDADIKLLLVGGRVSDELDYAARLLEGLPELAEATDGDDLRLASAPALRRVVLFDTPRPGFLSEEAFDRRGATIAGAEVHRRRHRVKLNDPVLIMYTSGTTSLPKGCVLSHEAMVRTVHNVAMRFQLTAADRYWSPLPLFHMGSINPIGAVFASGGAFLCSPRFEAGQALKMMEEERASVAFLAFAPIINDLVNHPEIATRDLSRLRALMSSAAVQPKPVQERLTTAFPGAIQIGMYGMTEGAGAVTCTAVYDSHGAGFRAVGRLMPGMSIRIVREDGGEADFGEVGEILFNGYGVFLGYYGSPEKTADVLRDGWIHSGDLGSLNEAGELMFHGRAKDMLKVGGENVASAEIEEFLHQHPAVKLCQVVGAPDERLTEVPAAFIELREDASASEQELIAFCRGKIASYKVPRYVRFVTDWPLTASSKVQKRELATLIAREVSITEDA